MFNEENEENLPPKGGEVLRDERTEKKFLLEELPGFDKIYEMLGVEINEIWRVLSDGELRGGVKDNLIMIAAMLSGGGFGALTQILTEQDTTMVNGLEIEKFPTGMNLGEEALEGGLPFAGGVLMGEMLYRLRVSRGWAEESASDRMTSWMIGGTFGYLGMFLLGRALHQSLGIGDVKLFGF